MADWMILIILATMAATVLWYYGPPVVDWIKSLWRR